MFAVSSIAALRLYYDEFARQQAQRQQDEQRYQPLKVGAIFSYAANEEAGGILGEEGFETGGLDDSSRDFLERAIADYNAMFGTSYDTSGTKFENYYKDLAKRIKSRELDLVVVVNMLLTGFDATTLNTLWVDKNLRQHGLVQAFSRTNRILNSVKTYGNIVCFRNLESNVDAALALFGNKDAHGTVLLKPYDEYYSAYEGLVTELTSTLPVDEDPLGESAEKQFIGLFGGILRLRDILTSFDEFGADGLPTPRQLQDYQSIYLNLHDKHRGKNAPQKESILDDVVFEIELIKQVEVNIDYILLLVQKWREAKGNGSEKEMEALVTIQNAVDSSPPLRNKRDLILEFVDSISVAGVDEDWSLFIAARREAELANLIASESLKDTETRTFVADAFQAGSIPSTGTALTRILPPTSRFSAGGEHGAKKQRVLEQLTTFFERYFGLG